MIGLAIAVAFRKDRSAASVDRLPQLAARRLPGARVAALPLVLPGARPVARAPPVGDRLGAHARLPAPLRQSSAGPGGRATTLRIAAFTLATVAALAHDALEPAAQIPQPERLETMPHERAQRSIRAGITRPSSPP